MVIDYTATSITTNCQFAPGSPARGCSILIFREDTPFQTISVMRDPNEQGLPLSVEGTVSDLESAVYTVRVYDIESDGQISTDGTPAHTQRVDISQPPTTSNPSTSDTPGLLKHTPSFPIAPARCVCKSEYLLCSGGDYKPSQPCRTLLPVQQRCPHHSRYRWQYGRAAAISVCQIELSLLLPPSLPPSLSAGCQVP